MGHAEAGLRTGHKRAPFPEEINRKLTGAIADLHFALTAAARANLLREGVDPATIFVTGNTVIDALLDVTQRLKNKPELSTQLDKKFAFLDATNKLILVTGHRCENFGEGFENICNALADILAARQLANVHLIDPVDYLPVLLVVFFVQAAGMFESHVST